jgi:hypothetical protein
MTPRRFHRVDEAGATLVLALVFMIVVALVLLALVTFSGNGILNTSNLLQQQSLEYRSAGAVEVAIQTVRYTDTTYTGGSCFGCGSPTVQIGQALPNNPPVHVTCSTVPVSQLPPNTGVTREINVYACGSSSCGANNYTVWATVDFQDGSTCSVTSLGTCGQTESIKSWLVHNANS